MPEKISRIIFNSISDGVFTVDQSRRVLEAARAHGMEPRLHADELHAFGAAELAAEVGAVSADHLVRVSDEGIRAMADAGVVAVLGVLSPEVLGTGQAFIGQLLRNEASIAVWTLLGVAVIKAVATAGTFGARGSGGIFMPSLFIGAAIGSALAQMIEPYWSVIDCRKIGSIPSSLLTV